MNILESGYNHNLEVEARIMIPPHLQVAEIRLGLNNFCKNRASWIPTVTQVFRDRLFKVANFMSHSGQKYRLRDEGDGDTILTYKIPREHPRLFVDDEFSKRVPSIDSALSEISGMYRIESLKHTTKQRTVYLVELSDATLEICFDALNPGQTRTLPEYIEVECIEIDGLSPQKPERYIEVAEEKIIQVADMIGLSPKDFTKKTIKQLERDYGIS